LGEGDYNLTKGTKLFSEGGIMKEMGIIRLTESNCKINNFERGLYEKI